MKAVFQQNLCSAAWRKACVVQQFYIGAVKLFVSPPGVDKKLPSLARLGPASLIYPLCCSGMLAESEREKTLLIKATIGLLIKTSLIMTF